MEVHIRHLCEGVNEVFLQRIKKKKLCPKLVPDV